MEPRIYTLVGCPVIGGLGKSTQVEHFPVCRVCNRRTPSKFTSIEYCFDYWGGEDLVTAMGYYAASDRLCRAIEEAGLTGITFEKMKVSKGDYFEITEPAYQNTLPSFHQLIVTGVAKGPEIWWTSTFCKACGLTSWTRTSIGRKAAAAYTMGTIGVPQEVFKDSWNGDDMFNLQDAGHPIITERFADVIKKITEINQDTCTGVHLHLAKWVE